MRKNRFLLVAALASTTWLFAKTVADYDHSVNFSKYHTYSWAGVNMQDSLWKDRVTKAIDTQLSAKGWSKVDSGGDASVVAVGSTRMEQTVDTWYEGGFGGGWRHQGWGGPGFATTTVERTPVGTLHVDIFDANTKKVIWHASVDDTLTGDPEKNEKKLEKALAELFKKFPPPEKG